jgi:hypothetical protein
MKIKISIDGYKDIEFLIDNKETLFYQDTTYTVIKIKETLCILRTPGEQEIEDLKSRSAKKAKNCILKFLLRSPSSLSEEEIVAIRKILLEHTK